MDESNQHLKHLLKQTDIAFKALMRDPASLSLHEQYERAKLELDSYTASLKHSLTQRTQHQRHR
jgi:exonuclease VII large subunit